MAFAPFSRQIGSTLHRYVNSDYGFSLEIPNGMTAEPFSGPWSMESMMGYGGRAAPRVVLGGGFCRDHRGGGARPPPPPSFFSWDAVGGPPATAHC